MFKYVLIAAALLALSGDLASRQVTVAATETVLSSNVNRARSPYSVLLVNQGAVSVFLGPTGVTTSTGLELKAAASLAVDLQPSETLYGIVASTTARVDVLEGGK